MWVAVTSAHHTPRPKCVKLRSDIPYPVFRYHPPLERRRDLSNFKKWKIYISNHFSFEKYEILMCYFCGKTCVWISTFFPSSVGSFWVGLESTWGLLEFSQIQGYVLGLVPFFLRCFLLSIRDFSIVQIGNESPPWRNLLGEPHYWPRQTSLL